MRSPRRDILSLPYGVWTTDDGAEIMFDRTYTAMYRRRPGEPAEQMDPTKRVPGVVRTEYFYVGIVSRELCRKLLQIEHDFVAGGDIEARFWKPQEPTKPAETPARPFLKPVVGNSRNEVLYAMTP